MINWFKYPFIRILIPFTAGIIMAFVFRDALSLYLFDMMVVSVIFSLLLVVSSFFIKRYDRLWLFGILLFFVMMIDGMVLVCLRNDLGKYHISEVMSDYSFCVARLSECIVEKENSVKVVIETLCVANYDGKMIDCEGKIMCYFEKTPESLSLEYGDVMAFITKPEIVSPALNPEQFDYKKYLLNKNITHQVYLNKDSWIDLGDDISNPIYGFSYFLRDYLLRTMYSLGIEGKEYSVAAAILLGYDDELGTELRQKYVVAGAMHLLCVSSLHVGVIFMLFSYMLAFLDKKHGTQQLKQMILLFLIWFYALLAGLAPSILRATIMLSFVVVGNIIKRKGILMNTIAASAFILLLVDPANLFDVGFQLSYVAVIGIVVLQPHISRMFCFKYGLINKVWEITSVSLAAQVATAPFAIYYFHQFPSYFWLSNLFMTPVSTVVITGGMIMLLLCFLPYFNIAVAFCVKMMIKMMNGAVVFIENMPFSLIRGLYIDKIDFVLLLIAVLCLLLCVEYRNKMMFFVLLGSVLLFGLSGLSRTIKQRNTFSMTVYCINKSTAVDFTFSNTHILLCDTVLMSNSSAMAYNIENNLIKEGVFRRGHIMSADDRHITCKYLKKRENLISFGGKTMALIDDVMEPDLKLERKIHLDFMIVRGRMKTTLGKLLDVYDVDLLIVDSSVPDYLKDRWKEQAAELNIPCWAVKDEGAFVYKDKI